MTDTCRPGVPSTGMVEVGPPIDDEVIDVALRGRRLRVARRQVAVAGSSPRPRERARAPRTTSRRGPGIEPL